MEFRDNNVYTDTALSDPLLCAASSESLLVNFTTTITSFTALLHQL